MIAHPPALLAHLAEAYLTPPQTTPPYEKFWSVFLPFSEREYEVDQIVFGRSGTGSGAHEIVVQVLVRDGQERGKRRAIERVLEAWSSDRDGACELGELHGLASVMRPVPRAEEVRSFVVIVHRMTTRLYS